MRKTFHFAVGVLATVLAAGPASATEKFIAAGSSTIQPVMEDMKAVFDAAGYKVTVQGGGTGVGVKTAQSGMALIGMASRELSAEEKTVLNVTAFAKDAVAIIVHSSNPMTQISSAEIKEIFSGKTAKWKSGQAITVISKEPGRATLEVFEEHFGLKGQIRKDAVIIGPNGQAVAATAGDKNAIGFVSLGDAAEAVKQGLSLKILVLDGVTPSPETVKDGTYSLSRNLNLVYLPKNEKQAKKIIDLFFTAEGKAVIAKHTFLPI